jgi:hypothetical protein
MRTRTARSSSFTGGDVYHSNAVPFGHNTTVAQATPPITTAAARSFRFVPAVDRFTAGSGRAAEYPEENGLSLILLGRVEIEHLGGNDAVDLRFVGGGGFIGDRADCSLADRLTDYE